MNQGRHWLGRWSGTARRIFGVALARIAVDPVGRTGLALTGLVAALGCTLLGTALMDARTDMMELITHRVFGLSAVPLTWGDGRAMSAVDVSRLLPYAEIAVTCSRPSEVVTPTGGVIPIQRVAGSEAGLERLGTGLRRGRRLGAVDTISITQGALLGERLAALVDRGARVADAGRSTKVVGVLATPQESPTSLALMTLLRPSDVATACSGGVVDVGIAGPLATAETRAARIAWLVQDRQPSAALLPKPLQLVPVLPAALLRKVADAEHTTTIVLTAAMGIFAAAAMGTIFVLVVVRAEGRRADIGVARAVGAPRTVIVAEFVAESAILGLVAGGAGALVAWLSIAVVLHAASFGHLSAGVAFAAFTGVLGTFELAAWWTARDVTRQPPHELFAGERW